MNMELDAHPHLVSELKDFLDTTGRYAIRIKGCFESAHYLYNYFPDGRDEPMHGHSWQVEVFMERLDGGLGQDGISYDFLRARKRLDMLIERIEHVCINDLAEFKDINPTSENIARWFYQGLKQIVQADGARISKIMIHEGPDNIAIFKPGHAEAS